MFLANHDDFDLTIMFYTAGACHCMRDEYSEGNSCILNQYYNQKMSITVAAVIPSFSLPLPR